jgi:hypothetical protein
MTPNARAGERVNAEPGTPQRIFEIALAFRRSKALLTAVELGLFSALAEGPLESDALVRRLALHGRGARDFFDALVALGLLARDAGGRYANTREAEQYLDRRNAAYVGGFLEYLNARAYGSWGLLTPALRSGMPQSGPFEVGGFDAYYADDSALAVFVRGMTGGSLMPAKALAAKFPWPAYRTVIDVGTAEGCVPVEIAHAHAHLTGGGFDLPVVGPAFARYVHERGLDGRLEFHPGDFLSDPLPKADVLIMGRVLHDWDLQTRKLLLTKACAALPPGGALIVWETLIDDARRGSEQALLSSLNMLIQTAAGAEYTSAECSAWLRECGFGETRILPLVGAYTAVVGIKPGAAAYPP